MRQPWLQDPATPPPRGTPDDFSPRSATSTAAGAALALAVALLLLAAGRAAEILDAAYGLPLLPGTETLIAAAEAWDAAMESLGVNGLVAAVRGLLSAGRG
jgi:hypothetical protein